MQREPGAVPVALDTRGIHDPATDGEDRGGEERRAP